MRDADLLRHPVTSLQQPSIGLRLQRDLSGAPDLQATATTSTYIDYRHRKAFNGLYADGHVDTIKRPDAARLITVQNWRMSNQY